MARHTPAEVAALAARMSSEPDSVVWGAGSVRDRGRRWDVVRGRLARAIVAAPDIVAYFRFLLASRAVIQFRRLQTEMDALILSLEGLFLEHVSAPPDTRALAVQAAAALDALRGGTPPDGAGIDRLLVAAAAVIKKGAERTRAGPRLQPRGDEARRRYRLAADAVSKTWMEFSATMAGLRERHVGTPALVQRYALEVPLENLRKTAALGVVLDRETEYVSQLLAGLAAVQMAARPFEFGIRFRYDTVQPSTASATGPILSRPLDVRPVFNESRQPVGVRLSMPADLLDVKEQDFVLVNGALRTSVDSVSGDTIMFSDTLEQIRSLMVVSPLWAQVFVTLPELVDQFFLDNPTKALNPRRIDLFSSFEEVPALIRRVPEVPGDLAATGFVVGSLYRLLYASMPAEVDRAARQLFPQDGVSPIEPYRSLEQVWQLALITFADTSPVRPGRAVLSMLRAEGFDRAAERLILGKLDEVLQMTAEQANYASHTAFIAAGGV